jgi:molybdopterin-guanine dinucleotide biosynthesis protein A
MATAAILVGGHARRMGGRDKSALRVGGRTILERQLATLDGIVDRVLLVGAAGARDAVTTVSDRVPGCGPLGGLDAALAAAGHGPLLLLACDMPHLTRAFLAHLLSLAGRADAVVPRTERGYHPLCAVYASSCRSIVERQLDERHLRMLDLLGLLRVRAVEADDLERFGDANHLLANVNTLADLDALETRQNH